MYVFKLKTCGTKSLVSLFGKKKLWYLYNTNYYCRSALEASKMDEMVLLCESSSSKIDMKKHFLRRENHISYDVSIKKRIVFGSYDLKRFRANIFML